MDYVRFMTYAKKELPEVYQIINVRENRNGQMIPRIVNSNVITTERSLLENFHGCPYVVELIFCV